MNRTVFSPLRSAEQNLVNLMVFSSLWTAEELFARCTEVTVSPAEGLPGAALVTCGERRILWFHAENAGSLMDSIFAAQRVPCKRMLLLDACCALSNALQPGDLVVPNKTIHGGDPLFYLEHALPAEDTELEVRRTPPRGVLWANMTAYQRGMATTTRTVFSCETRSGLSGWLKLMQESGAEAIDSLSSVFSRCMSRIGVDGASLLLVTERMQGAALTAEEAQRVAQRADALAEMLLAMAVGKHKAA